MMWVTKAKSASGAGRGRLLPGLETKQPGLEPIVGEAFQPSGEKKSRTRRAHCLRRQRVCLIFFIFLLFCLLCLCSAASETQDRSLEDAAKALTPERKASHSEVPASVGERVKKGNLQPLEGVTQVTDDLQVASLPPAPHGEASSEASRAMQSQKLRERVFDVLLCAFLINLGLVLVFLAVVLLIKVIRAELARRNAGSAGNPSSRLVVVQCMVPHPCAFSEHSCSLYGDGGDPVINSTACSTPRLVGCPCRSPV